MECGSSGWTTEEEDTVRSRQVDVEGEFEVLADVLAEFAPDFQGICLENVGGVLFSCLGGESGFWRVFRYCPNPRAMRWFLFLFHFRLSSLQLHDYGVVMEGWACV